MGRVARKAASTIPQPDIRIRAFGCNDHSPCYKLMSTYEYVDYITFWTPVIIRIPAGFHYDGASVPKIVRSLLDEVDLKLTAPLVHDVLYRYGGDLPSGWLSGGERRFYTRREADALFRRILDEEGVPKRREWAAWIGVRLGGRCSWDSRRKQAWGGR